MKRNPQQPQSPLQVGLISLGCAKNLVDAEIMLGSLLRDGIQITNDAAQADVVIVNTCSFIDAAQEESVDTILESVEFRDAQRRGQGLVVSGCLSQRFREDLPKLLPEVDAFMGIDQVAQAGDIVRQALAIRTARVAAQSPPGRKPKGAARIKRQLAQLTAGESQTAQDTEESLRGSPEFGRTRTLVTPPAAAPSGPSVEVHARPTYIPDYETPRFRLTPRHFAYLKIAEGCNHPCSFCIIPRMRGSHRSRAETDIVAEARALLADGVKEINLISQDSTYYGMDLRPGRAGSISSPEKFRAASRSLPAGAATLSTLLRALNDLRGDFWIRLLYTHPAHWTDDLIQTIADCPKVARYVDMPLQHIHDNMLERMRRETDSAFIEDLIARIRAGIPGIALRTTFIVGFPGETEACFERLLDFIRTTRFERLGVFTYSREEGTRAGKMAGQVPEKRKRDRRDRAMAEQRRIAREIAAASVGREIQVLVERSAAAADLNPAEISSWEHGFTRSENDSDPGLRGSYWLCRGEADAPDIDGRVYVRGRLEPGGFAKVRIVGHTDYDLTAVPA